MENIEKNKSETMLDKIMSNYSKFRQEYIEKHKTDEGFGLWYAKMITSEEEPVEPKTLP